MDGMAMECVLGVIGGAVAGLIGIAAWLVYRVDRMAAEMIGSGGAPEPREPEGERCS